MLYLEGYICAKHSGNLISGLQSIQYISVGNSTRHIAKFKCYEI